MREWDKGKGRGSIGISRGITSYFFTHFSYTLEVLYLQRIFIQFGKVFEVFISPRKGKIGIKYGFVCVKEVENFVALEKKLHNIFVGNMRMMVNFPNFEKQKKWEVNIVIGTYAKTNQQNTTVKSVISGKGELRPEKSYVGITTSKTHVVAKHSRRLKNTNKKEDREDVRWGYDIRMEENNTNQLARSLIATVLVVKLIQNAKELSFFGRDAIDSNEVYRQQIVAIYPFRGSGSK